MTPPLSINPALDAGALAARFAGHGRIHVPDFLAGQGAAPVEAACDLLNSGEIGRASCRDRVCMLV